MPSFEVVRTLEITEEAQEAIEDVAAYLSQTYGFDFPLELLETCYRQVTDADILRAIAEKVQMRVIIDPEDMFDDEKMVRHLARLERAFQFYIDEHLS